MIVRRGLDLTRLVRSLGVLLAALLAYDVAVTALYMAGDLWFLSINDLPLPLLGSALVLVVTLRNNAAYARWWEARGLWGAIGNNARSLVRGVQTMSTDAALHRAVADHQVAYVMALRCKLLGTSPWDDVARHLPPEELAPLRAVANVPLGIHLTLARRLRETMDDRVGLLGLHATLSALTDAQGGLERIKSTPMPRQYMQFPMVFSRVYCLLLPLGLVADLGWMTPVGSTVIGFMFLALDRIGADLEDPFEGRMHDVPMLAITRAIEIDLMQAVGVTDVRAPIEKIDGVLW